MTYSAAAGDTLPKLPSATYPKIFVVGCPRSGTTWTAHMLDKHPSVTKLSGESHLYKLLYDPFTYLKGMSLRSRLTRRNWILKHYGPTPILTGFNSNNLWRGLLQTYRFYKWSGERSGPHMVVDYETFKALVKKARAGEGDDLSKVNQLIASIFDVSFRQKGGDSSQVMLEKTPMHIKFASPILRSFPEAKMVEVVRDIRSICASWQARAKKQRWARRPTADLVAQWIRAVEAGDRAKTDTATGDRIMRLKYEDLRQAPHSWLEKSFHFAELPITNAHLDEIINTLSIDNHKEKGEGLHVRTGRVDGWKDELSTEDIETCHRMAGPTLERLGYWVK
ncbi:MAG: sulfotransferase [Cyanobacteria bacterium P01_D01_bin.36]